MTNDELIIYNWLQGARLTNRKAKNRAEKNVQFLRYNEKYETIFKSLKKIKEIKSENITYRWDYSNGMSCIHFYFNGDVKQKSISFHIAPVYDDMLKNITKEK